MHPSSLSVGPNTVEGPQYCLITPEKFATCFHDQVMELQLQEFNTKAKHPSGTQYPSSTTVTVTSPA